MIVDLNRWSAEVVMGWHKIMAPSWPYVDSDGNKTGFSEYGSTAWTPLTDWNQLKLVIEKMRELEWYVCIENVPDTPYWSCSVFPDVSAPYRNSHIKENDDLPTAVLQAAYEAIRD